MKPQEAENEAMKAANKLGKHEEARCTRIRVSGGWGTGSLML